jgi:transposase-like protein
MPKEQVPGKPQTRRYTPDEKAAAVRMVRTLRAELGTEHGTVQRVATQLGYGVESVRQWVKQADIDEGHVCGVTTAEAQRTKELGQENRELKRANEMADSSGGSLSSGRSSTVNQEVVAFIDANRDDMVDGTRLGVESICRTLFKAGLPMAPSTYYAAKSREPSARALRDVELRPALRALWEDNYRVYGARKLWKAAKRAGHDVGRDQVARLMRAEGIEGVRRTKRVRTTKPDPTATRHPDLVKRDFTATRPN